MGINKSWRSTLAFRKFREKTHELSKIYWVQQLGTDTLTENLRTLPGENYSVKELVSSFDLRMYPSTVKETLDWLPTYMNRNRLHLLVVYTAFLESYLKSVTFFHIASIGYVENNESIQEMLNLILWVKHWVVQY